MLKQLPVNKNYLLIALSLLLLFVCYQLAFKQTVDAWQINKQLKSKISESADITIQPAFLSRKLANLNSLLDRFKTDSNALRNTVINKIAGIGETEGVKLSEVPERDATTQESSIIADKLSFEGSFTGLMKTLQKLQQTSGIGNIRSVTMRKETVRNGNLSTGRLVLDVYLVALK